MEFAHISIELKINILQYLSNDLHRKFRTVCKQWADMCSVPNFQRSLVLNNHGHHTSDDVAHQLLTKYCRLHHLSVKHFQHFDWINQIPKRYFLRTLYFEDCHFESADSISQLVTHFPHVTAARFFMCDGFCDDYITKISGWNLLRTICISNTYFIDAAVSNVDCTLLAEKCSYLHPAVFVDSCIVSESSFLTLLNLRGSNLSKLYLTCDALTDASYHALSQCSNLIALSLTRCIQLTSCGLKFLKGLYQLKTLAINDATELSSADFVDLFDGDTLLNLQRASFNGCTNFGDVCLIAMIKKFVNLKEIEISECFNITDDGIRAIASSNLKHLEYLQIWGLDHLNYELLMEIINQFPGLVIERDLTVILM